MHFKHFKTFLTMFFQLSKNIKKISTLFSIGGGVGGHMSYPSVEFFTGSLTDIGNHDSDYSNLQP